MPTIHFRPTEITRNPGVISGLILIISVIFLVGAGGVVGWVFHTKATGMLQSEMEERLISLTQLVNFAVSQHWNSQSQRIYEPEKLQKLLEKIRHLNRLENLFIFDRDLKSIADARPTIPKGKQYSMLQLEPSCIESVWEGNSTISGRRDLTGTHYMSVYSPALINEHRFYAAIYAETDTSFLEPLIELRRLLTMLGLSVLLLAIIQIFLLARILKRLQRSHQRALKLETHTFASRVGAEVAHEIKNPLGIIRATIDALRRKYDPNKEDERYAYIAEEVQRLNEITSRLTSLSSEENLQLKPVDIKEYLRLFAEEISLDDRFKHIKIEMKIDAPIDKIVIDKDKFRQVLLNLFINAMQAQNNSGQIDLLLEKKSWKNKSWAMISVQDHGTGMKRTQLQNIFEPFFTTKNTGTGLGLAVVGRIIESHLGHIKISSAPSRGTHVEIFLPLE